MIILPVPSLLPAPVLAELQQASLITNEECERLSAISDVIRVQSGKSPEVLSKTADVLQRHGFEKESSLLAGRHSIDPHPMSCVQWSLLMMSAL